MENEGRFEVDSKQLPELKKYKKGVSDIIKKDNYYYVVKTNEVLPAGTKTLEECKGE